MTAIEGILFDKDGTLFDFAASWSGLNLAAGRMASQGDAALFEHLLRLGGADPATGRVAADSLLAVGNAAEIAALWAEAGSPFPAEELAERLDALFRAGAPHMAPVTDLAELFARLKNRGLKLGIASSDGEAAIADAATHFGFADQLDFIAGYDSGHGFKPHPGMALAFSAVTGTPPQGLVMVGDNRHDMDMGRSAGFGLCVGVLTGTGTRATLDPCSDLVLDTIGELEAALWPGSEGVRSPDRP